MISHFLFLGPVKGTRLCCLTWGKKWNKTLSILKKKMFWPWGLHTTAYHVPVKSALPVWKKKREKILQGYFCPAQEDVSVQLISLMNYLMDCPNKFFVGKKNSSRKRMVTPMCIWGCVVLVFWLWPYEICVSFVDMFYLSFDLGHTFYCKKIIIFTCPGH